MQSYVIEREIPGIGGMSPAEIALAATKSNAALAKLGPRLQWQHSYVAGNKTFCVYLAEDEAAITEHAALCGLPATKITPVNRTIDPTSAQP